MRLRKYKKSVLILVLIMLIQVFAPAIKVFAADKTIVLNEDNLTRKNSSKMSVENCIIPNDKEDYFNFEIDIKNENGVSEGKIYKEEHIRDNYYLKTEYQDVEIYNVSDNGDESKVTSLRTVNDGVAFSFEVKDNFPTHLRIRGIGRIDYNLKQDGKDVEVSGKHYYNEEEKDFFGMKVETSGVEETFHIPLRGKNTSYNPTEPTEPTKPEVEYPEILDTEPWDEGMFLITSDGSGVRIYGINNDYSKINEYKERKTFVIPEKIGGKDVVSFGHGSTSLFQNRGFKFNQIIWPDTIKEIKSNTFSGYENELYISLPKNLTKLGVSSFSGIKNLKGNLELPSTLTTIEPYIFSGCENLESKLIIPEGVTSIGDGAFENCYKLYGDLEIPRSVKTIGFRAFKRCTGFHGALILNEGLEEVNGSAFEFENSTAGTWVGNYSSDIRIPSTLKTIGWNSFYPGTNYDKYRYNISLVFFDKGQLANTNFANDQQLSIATYDEDIKSMTNSLNARYRNFIEISPPSYEPEKEGVNPIIMDKAKVKIGEELNTTIPICISEPTYDRRMEGNLDIDLVNKNLRYGGILDDKFQENPIGVKFYDIDKEKYFTLDYSIKNNVITLNIKENTPIHFNVILDGVLHEVDNEKDHQSKYEIFSTVKNVKNVVDGIDDEYTITKTKTVDVIPTTYSITYNANEPEETTSTGVVPVDNTEYEKNEPIIVKGNDGKLAVEGYIFKGWALKSDSKEAVTEFDIKEDTILYAIWDILPPITIKKVDVQGKAIDGAKIEIHQKREEPGQNPGESRVIKGGTEKNEDYEKYGTYDITNGEIQLKLPEGDYLIKEVVAPNGYKLENDKEIEFSNPSSDLKEQIFEIVNEKILKVTYDGNGNTGGTVPLDDSIYVLGEEVTVLDKNNMEKANHTFTGWNTKADGTGTPYAVGAKFNITEDTTLYAEWKENTKPPVKPEGTIKNITLIGGKATLTEKVEEQLKEFKLNRISGKNRYATSVQVSKAYKNSDIVVLASGEKYTDELTATVLASKLNVPILLSEKDVVPEVVIKEIERLGATKVILIGEKGTLSKSVETQLSKYKLERIGGVDRYETSVLIGDQVRTITGNKTQSILVDGTNFPDAIAMTSMGVEQGLPIILTQPNELNKITEKAVKDWGITKVTIGGGTASVSSNIENALKAIVEVERIKGIDRYETSVLVAKQVYKNPTHAVVASGEVFPDAIVGAPYAAKNKYPIVLSRGNSVPQVVLDYVVGK